MDTTPSPIALITGASSGIGAAFARQLARRGYHLILVARRVDRLSSLAVELQAQCPVHVDILPADLADPAGLAAVADRIGATPDLALLVNNAGFGTRGSFRRVEVARHTEMIELHTVAATQLMYAVLPGMLARSRGDIINVASLLAFIPFPGSVTYCATKSYLVMFSRALDLEVRRRGVRLQALCPGLTRTEFHDTIQTHAHDLARFSGFLWSSADEVVAASLRSLDRGQLVCIPGVKNRLLVAFGSSPVAAPIIGRLIR